MVFSGAGYDDFEWFEEDSVYRCEDYRIKGFPITLVEKSLREQGFKEVEDEDYETVLEDYVGNSFRLAEDSYFEVDFGGLELSRMREIELHHALVEGHTDTADTVTRLFERELNAEKVPFYS